MKTRLTERYGLTHPIVSAPMALVAGGRLAAAISAAGGLGLLGGGYAGTLGGESDLDEEFDLAAGQRVGIGFITWALSQAPKVLEQALARRPVMVFLSFGDPRTFAGLIRVGGADLACQIQNLHQAAQAVEAGAAVIVAQGTEAGGHGGGRSTMPLVPEVADYLAREAPDTVLLAAGGIADGRGLAAALMLGADGVLVGSRFWASAEALTPDAAVARGIRATGDDTVRTRALDRVRGVPWPDEYSFRVVRNRFVDDWADRESAAAEAYGTLANAYAQARTRQDFDTVAIVAGECVGLIHDRPPAGQLVASIVAEATRLIQNGPALLE